MKASEKLRFALDKYRKETGSSVRALERALAFGDGGVKAIIRAENPSIPSLDKAEAILDRLGLTITIGAGAANEGVATRAPVVPVLAQGIVQSGITPAEIVGIELDLGSMGTVPLLMKPELALEVAHKLIVEVKRLDNQKTGSD